MIKVYLKQHLKRIANGADLKIINQTIQTYTMNYESTEQVELK
ncbi:hypothetical protein Nizo2741_2361 [Lactiplantibacillus plantarum]|nr:hypothetical protein [Lactiplantibacillus plantarum]KZU36407.1 hypothetical protein Nizo2741_2361 [Lactiplantibacillus plantarum]